MKKAITISYKTDISIFLLLAIVLILGGGILFTFNTLQTDPIEEALSGEGVLSILFILEGNDTALGSYVMMYSPMNNRAAAISIPGDTGRILKTVDRVDRIDSVYRPGNANDYKIEIEELLGIPIAYSIIFEKDKLSKMIDAIGGVDIFIPRPIEIYDPDPILFPSGITKLDGDKAIQYILFEIPEEDQNESGIRRERFFLGLLKSLGDNSILLKNKAVAQHIYPNLKTGMNQIARRKLLESLYNLDIDRINMQTVSGAYREMSGQRLLMPSHGGMVIKDVARQAQRSLTQVSQGTIIERVFTVEILNGTTTTGMASQTAELIRGFNYDVISVGNADRNNYTNTEIIDRTGIEQVAASFAAVIRCNNIRHEPNLFDEEDDFEAAAIVHTPENRADFTLIIGRDFNGRIVTGN